MFRGLKKRLSSGSNNQTAGGPSSTSSSQGGAGSSDAKSSFRVTLRMNKDPKYDVAQLKSMVTHLASFDACVEAADALAVQSPIPCQEHSSLSRKHHPSGLPDPSVLVSVDGNLLFVPPVDDPRSVFNTETVPQQQAPAAEEEQQQLHEERPEIEPSSLETQERSSPPFSKLMTSGKDDYESSVYLGNDIDGDRKLNGFSAMGWSLPAASHALGQCEASLHNLLTFTENILLNRKEAAAKMSQTCDALREFMPSLGGAPPVPMVRTSKLNATGGSSRGTSLSSVDDWEIVDPRANEFVPNTPDRTGPLVTPNSSLDRALVILEEYFAHTAEAESEFWREATTKQGSMLPKLQEAYQRVSQRVQQRDEALEQASQRARLLEERLQGLRKEAEQKWAKVFKTEERVQSRLEALWQERSRQREKARLEKLHKENEAASFDMQQQSTEDILNLVAQISEDGGSFEPMELMRTPVRKRGKSLDSIASGSDQDSDFPPQSSVSSPGTMAISREDLEQEFKLPELRSNALLADERVEDAAQDLLQALSNLDTTRRAARVVAETAMVNAGNAQVHCIREFVSIERKAIEQRLEMVKNLEKSLDNTETNVRKDLDNYITSDKKERGGTSHLGDDDDGGIASALAVLSSHVNAHSEGETRSIDDQGGGSDSPSVSREEVLAALEQFFEPDQQPAETDSSEVLDLDKATELLCRTGSSPNSRSIRSTICYALNSKRSTSAEIPSLAQFEGLCKVFDAVLTSYVTDDTGMSNAKMLMMLAQTFYYVDLNSGADKLEASPSRPKREKRIYVRNRLTGHAIWSNDAFWDEAFRTAMAESLTVSGVMSNFERRNQMVHTNRDYGQSRGSMVKWYDLNYEERIGAASQVHAVICAQLGALAHSMIEFGCGLERSCAFVRRTAIRNQLPTSQRIMLLQHLMKRHDAELLESRKI